VVLYIITLDANNYFYITFFNMCSIPVQDPDCDRRNDPASVTLGLYNTCVTVHGEKNALDPFWTGEASLLVPCKGCYPA